MTTNPTYILVNSIICRQRESESVDRENQSSPVLNHRWPSCNPSLLGRELGWSSPFYISDRKNRCFVIGKKTMYSSDS